MIDTIREIETPEGISLRLRAAGALPRAQAWTLDLLLRAGMLFVAAIPLSLFGVGGNGVVLLLIFALMWAYSVVFEVCWNGQTPGKRALGLRVVNADGTPVTWLPSVVRNLLRVVDILPGVYGVGLISTLVDPCARRLGDIVAGTVVIHASELPAGQQVPTMAAIPLSLVLAVDEQAALVEFTERAAQLTVQRQEELANLLTPLTGLHDTAAIRRLVAHANWLLGRA
ncbi:MAG: RDD family protein [Rhodanobacter sp.]